MVYFVIQNMINCFWQGCHQLDNWGGGNIRVRTALENNLNLRTKKLKMQNTNI
jgi:hypothetical protein